MGELSTKTGAGGRIMERIAQLNGLAADAHWRRVMARAMARGFEDALAGAPSNPKYKTQGTREDYRIGFELGTRLFEEAVHG